MGLATVIIREWQKQSVVIVVRSLFIIIFQNIKTVYSLSPVHWKNIFQLPVSFP